MVGQSEAQIVGRAGERWFESALPPEWIFERPREDIGLDGTVITGSNKQTGGLEFRVQIKASRKWNLKKGRLQVRGVARSTIQLWGQSTTPVLLVLYDVTKDKGYYAWALDIVPDPRKLIASQQDTLTLGVPASSVLDRSSWPDIQRGVEEYHLRFVNLLGSINASVACLRTVTSLATALGLLQTPQFAMGPFTKHDTMFFDTCEVKAHAEVVSALAEFSSGWFAGTAPAAYAAAFAAAYRSEVEAFIEPGTLQSFLQSPQQDQVVWFDQPKLQAARPRLMLMIGDCIVTLGRFVLRDPSRSPGGVVQQIVPGEPR
jgi:hypothetical protein